MNSDGFVQAALQHRLQASSIVLPADLRPPGLRRPSRVSTRELLCAPAVAARRQFQIAWCLGPFRRWGGQAQAHGTFQLLKTRRRVERTTALKTWSPWLQHCPCYGNSQFVLLVLGLETSCGMIWTHFISMPWMLWTLCKNRSSTGHLILARVCSVILCKPGLLQLPSCLPFISDWTKNAGLNQRCFKHLNSKIFALGSNHNREWFFFKIWSLNQKITLYSSRFSSHAKRVNRQCTNRSTGMRRLFTQTRNLKRTNLQSSYSEPHYI